MFEMKNFINKNNIPLSGVICSGIICRMYFSVFHFTHIDDIGVANTLILDKLQNCNTIEIINNFIEFWTYAPFQIVFTSKLVNENWNYIWNIFLGRLPSLIFGISAMLFLIYMIKKNCCKEASGNHVLLLLSAIIAFSWENIIYSAQMEPYEAGVFFSIVIIFFLLEKKYENWNESVVMTILLTIGCYSQYQIFMLVFSAYIVLFFSNIKNRRNLFRIIFIGFSNFILTLPLIFFLISSHKLEHSINAWNIGKGGIFQFDLQSVNIINNILYVIKFLVRNTFLCFKYMFVSDSFEVISNAITLFLIVLFIYGIIILHCRKELRVFAFYNDTVHLFFGIMVFKQSLAFGPSRHILFLIPIWLVVIGFGGCNMIHVFQSYHLENILKILTAGIVICFIFSLPDEISSRKNYMSEEYIQSIIDKYNPDIIYGHTFSCDLYLMNFENYSNFSEPVGRCWLQKNAIDKPDMGSCIVLVSRTVPYEQFLSNENYSNQFEERIEYFNLDIKRANLNNYKLIYKKEIPSEAEVDYAGKYYQNYSNGLYLYVLEYVAEN